MDDQRFMELCKLVSGEQDHKKLEALVGKISALLEGKYQFLIRMHLIDRVN